VLQEEMMIKNEKARMAAAKRLDISKKIGFENQCTKLMLHR
jgi:hypothetical protein